MPSNVAGIILELLSFYGVKNLYGVLGDAIFPLLSAISKQDKISYYAAAQESGAAFMALSEAALTGRLAVCTATSGPGVANLLNGLASAYHDKVSVLAVTGQVETKKIATKAKQYFDQPAAVKPFSIMSETIASPEAVVPSLMAAIDKAVSHKTVAHLSIPVDIFSAVPIGGLGPINPASIGAGNPPVVTRGIGVDTLQATLRVIQTFKNPLLLLGDRSKPLGKAAGDMAQRLGAGIVVALQARGSIDETHPGVLGGIGAAYMPPLLQEVDGILLIGSCPYELDLLPPGAKIVQIVEGHEDIYHGRVSQALVGDPGSIITAMAEQIPAKTQDTPWLLKIRREKASHRKSIAAGAANPQIPLPPARLMAEVEKTCADDAIICLDIGSFIHWFGAGFEIKRQDVLVSGAWRSMGSALPGAIAAKISAPSRQVLALVGDGGMLMSLGELATAVHYQLPVVTVVVNNGGYMLEKQKMALKGLTPFGYQWAPTNFCHMARGFGASGFRVENPDDLRAALIESFNGSGPAVIDVCTSDPPLPFLQ
jgi:pyruvate oxidase